MKKADEKMTDSFSFESSLLSYQITCEQDRVILLGKEVSKDKILYEKSLSFSREEEGKVREFYRILFESRTFPQMMGELAEEFFF